MIPVSRYHLNKAMYVGTRPENAEGMVAEKTAFLTDFDLTSAERTALAGPQFGMILELGGLPNLVFRYYRAHGLALDDFSGHLAKA